MEVRQVAARRASATHLACVAGRSVTGRTDEGSARWRMDGAVWGGMGEARAVLDTEASVEGMGQVVRFARRGDERTTGDWDAALVAAHGRTRLASGARRAVGESIGARQ